MRRATIVQTALVVELVILMLILLVGGGANRRQPTPTTFRPATEAEERQADADRLSAELDRIAEQREREQASRVPTGYLGH